MFVHIIASKRKIYDSRSTLYKSFATSSATSASSASNYRKRTTNATHNAKGDSAFTRSGGDSFDDYYRRRYMPSRDNDRFCSSPRKARYEDTVNYEDFIKDFEELFRSPERAKRRDDYSRYSEASNTAPLKRGNRYQIFTVRNILESTPFYRLFGKLIIFLNHKKVKVLVIYYQVYNRPKYTLFPNISYCSSSSSAIAYACVSLFWKLNSKINNIFCIVLTIRNSFFVLRNYNSSISIDE